jgi:CRISPR-associated protein Cas2
MARPSHLFIFCYDIERDSIRQRMAELLEDYLTRVQKSVFEGRLTLDELKRLRPLAAALLGPNDSLRVYCVSTSGLRLSAAYGAPPLPEAQDFYLL